MTKAGRELIEAMEEALAHARGQETGVRVHHVERPPVDVRAARKAIGMTQQEFAALLGVSPSGLRKWEQGQRQPNGAARQLIRVIEAAPDTVREVLAA